ncbi:Nucleolar protein 56 [Chionoecetes opilio]|uniref:Nucleolar protein 56 n=1 Tax=Chionoecetes opilio TaxID=41210 RepID=A0A8J4Y1J1_CHIOP|nr:Nucleolar protein 56 [Chionoecetes opilio]
MQMYVNFEHASGYGLFSVRQFEEVGAFLPQVEEAATEAAKFLQMVKMVGFRPFTSAAQSLQNMNAVTEGLLTEELKAFLETNLPKKKSKMQLGVCDPKLGAAINEAVGISVTHVGVVPELIRGIRTHLDQYVKGLSIASMKQTELGLGHSYSRGKVKFNVNRADNMIIQSIALVDQLDKDINTFAMRIKEWYSYHFPELAKVVTDNYLYSKCAHYIKDRKNLSEESLPALEEITMDSATGQAILDAARMSMGMDISPIDLMNIERFAKRVSSLSEYRKQLAQYLKNKMDSVAPNLAILIGEVVGARLISHAGSLTNLAKYPASTVQILGAEKALFRAIKTHSNTPKYGLIYHSTFIGRAGPTNKGRISRYLANKCAMASRIDCFSENLTSIFGERLREQVEERLKFYETGDIPRKNAEVMKAALEEHNAHVKDEKRANKRKLTDVEANDDEEVAEAPKKKKKKNRKSAGMEAEAAPEAELEEPAQASCYNHTHINAETPSKKKKKKQQQEVVEEQNGEDMEAATEAVTESPKKKKKKNKGIVQEEAALDVSIEGSAKKKKMIANGGGVEEEVATPEGTPNTKKNKKKKKHSLGGN